MLKVGLTGGIASGKSTVAAMLRELGAHLVDTDQLARRAVAPGSAGLAWIVKAFGPGVLGPDHGLDRARLRELVFNDPAQRQRLNQIVHPLVMDMVNEALARLERSEPAGVAVVDVPLLFEVGWQARFDCTVLVYAPPAVQQARLRVRDGVDAPAARAALAAQMPIADKRAQADFLVDNSGSLDETRKQVEGLWARLKGLTSSVTSRNKSEPS
ncbi:MAG: dephospho-CoA kinase [Desulfarculus sp.]|nr:MAG: dephospho-CoA kinase [Desulfarculus sp.]